MEAAADMSPEARAAMVENMVEGLAERLAPRGGPPEDWARLVGALIVLGQTGRAEAIAVEARTVFSGDVEAVGMIERAWGGREASGDIPELRGISSGNWRPGGRSFGLDLGTKTIGIAISDVGLRIAGGGTPLLHDPAEGPEEGFRPESGSWRPSATSAAW